MEEDIARQQRSDAMNLLAMQPAFPQVPFVNAIAGLKPSVQC